MLRELKLNKSAVQQRLWHSWRVMTGCRYPVILTKVGEHTLVLHTQELAQKAYHKHK